MRFGGKPRCARVSSTLSYQTPILRICRASSPVATLRREPSSTAQTLDLKTVDRYTPLKKLEVQGEWIHVEDETGRQAWVHESNVWKPMKIQSMDF